MCGIKRNSEPGKKQREADQIICKECILLLLEHLHPCLICGPATILVTSNTVRCCMADDGQSRDSI
jgi:hypothetical protein